MTLSEGTAALENGQRASFDSLLSGAGALREGDRITEAAGAALLSIGANRILQGRAYSKEGGGE